jgi:hypothetical protein
VGGGTNDIQVTYLPANAGQAASAAAQMRIDLATLVAAITADLTALAGGPHTILIRTIFGGVDNQGANPFYETCRLICDANRRTDWTNNAGGTAYVRTALLDLDLDPVFATDSPWHVTQPNQYYCDSVHPTYAGEQRIAGHVLQLLPSLGVAYVPVSQIGPLAILPASAILAWYRADLGLHLSGSALQSLDDQSGNANHLNALIGTITQNPAGGGSQAFFQSVASATASLTCWRNMSIPGDYEVFAVYRDDRTAGFDYLFDWPANQNAVLQTGVGALQLYPTVTNMTAIPAGDHLLNAQVTGNGHLVLDGGLQTANGTTPYQTNQGKFTIWTTNAGAAWGGRLYDILITNTLTAPQRLALLNNYYLVRYPSIP